MDSYSSITSKMKKYIINERVNDEFRMRVVEWMSEFGEYNYEVCKNIVKILKNKSSYYLKCYGEDIYENNLKDDVLSLIKKFAYKIYNRGGFTALQFNFYTMANFMNLTPEEVLELKHALNGVGDWVN